MTIEEILYKDVTNNSRDTTYEEAVNTYNKYAKVDGCVYRVGNTLFLVNSITDGILYFHTINAEVFSKFVQNANTFFKSVNVDICHTAVTYFDERKLKCLFYKPYTHVENGDNGFLYKGVINLKVFHGMG